MTEMIEKPGNAHERGKALAERLSTDQLRRMLDRFSGHAAEGRAVRGWIVDEIGDRYDRWSEQAPTHEILAEIAKIPYDCRADQIIADACALGLISRHQEALEADEQWHRTSESLDLESQNRGSAPYILEVMTRAGYAR